MGVVAFEGETFIEGRGKSSKGLDDFRFSEGRLSAQALDRRSAQGEILRCAQDDSRAEVHASGATPVSATNASSTGESVSKMSGPKVLR